MKKLLLIFTLILGSMVFTQNRVAAQDSPAAPLEVAQPAVQEDSAVQVDSAVVGKILSSGIDVRTLSETDLRNVVYCLDTSLVALQTKVIENSQNEHDHYQELSDKLTRYRLNGDVSDRDVLGVVKMIIVLALIFATIIICLFCVMKYNYRARQQKYELEKAMLENVGYSNPTMLTQVLPAYSRGEKATRFYFRAMIALFVIFIITLFFAVIVTANFNEFSEILAALILMSVSLGLGLGIVYLFKEYIKRINADGQQ